MQHLHKTHIRRLSLDAMTAAVVHARIQVEDKKITAEMAALQQAVVASKVPDMRGSMYANRTIRVARQQRIACNTYTLIARRAIITSLILRMHACVRLLV